CWLNTRQVATGQDEVEARSSSQLFGTFITDAAMAACDESSRHIRDTPRLTLSTKLTGEVDVVNFGSRRLNRTAIWGMLTTMLTMAENEKPCRFRNRVPVTWPWS